jgi:hypothetical protein
LTLRPRKKGGKKETTTDAKLDIFFPHMPPKNEDDIVGVKMLL